MPSESEFGTFLPRIVVEPPGPQSAECARRLAETEFPACSVINSQHTPVFWDEGAGANIKDVDGNIYIDLTAGFCVALAGHSNPRIADAVSQQSHRLMHSQGGLNPNPRRVLLAEKLTDMAPGELGVSLIASTGAEAVDIAIKTAVLFTGRQTIIAFQHGFHGKTTGALAATSINYYREPFLSMVPRSCSLCLLLSLFVGATISLV